MSHDHLGQDALFGAAKAPATDSMLNVLEGHAIVAFVFVIVLGTLGFVARFLQTTTGGKPRASDSVLLPSLAILCIAWVCMHYQEFHIGLISPVVFAVRGLIGVSVQVLLVAALWAIAGPVLRLAV